MSIKTPKLQKGSTVKILHLGDLHFERQTIRETALLQKVKELKPDLILLSGDILNLSRLHDEQSWQGARAIFQQLSAPLGVYLVTGSPAVDLEEIIPHLLVDLPVRLLKDEAITIPVGSDFITLVGSFCSHHPHEDGPALEILTQSIADKHRYRILLYHTPDLAPVAARLGYDLQLSGHTHGGQVCLPLYGALFTGSLYGKQFESGLYQMEDMKLYITRGIGLEGAGAPRVRFLCPPRSSSGKFRPVMIKGI